MLQLAAEAEPQKARHPEMIARAEEHAVLRAQFLDDFGRRDCALLTSGQSRTLEISVFNLIRRSEPAPRRSRQAADIASTQHGQNADKDVSTYRSVRKSAIPR